MKNILLSLSLVLSFIVTPPVWAAEARAASPEPVLKAENAASTELLLADFEDGELGNKLGGESGAWNMDESDINNSYTDTDVVDMTDSAGKPGKVLQLAYSVDSDRPSQNGFWTKLKNLDASGYDHLEFDLKGDAEKGFTDVFRVEIKKIKKPEALHADVIAVPEAAEAAKANEASKCEEKIKGSYVIHVTPEWQKISIPLNRLTGLIDFANPEAWKNPTISFKDLDELVFIFNDRHVSKKKGVIYIDNIRFVKTGNPGPTAVDFPPRKKEKTETKIEGLEFQRFLLKRLKSYPKQIVVKKEFPADDNEFLRTIAKDTWAFFDNIVDQEHGLVLDTIQLGEKEPLDEKGFIGDYTNVTNIGVYLMVVVSAVDLGFITREEGVKRLTLTLDTISKLEYHKSGFPYNYYDTTTAERTSYFVSLVDSGWLVAGLYVVKNAFPEELGAKAEALIKRGNFSFFYDPVERQMFHGYYENLDVTSDYHYGVFYTEPRATSYIAIAQGDVPEEHWFEGLVRTFPESYCWQNQKPVDRVEKTVNGHKYFGGHYEWKDMKYVPSWGGSGFEALMPTLILDEKDLAPKGLGLNDKHHVEGQIRYAMNELGYPVWGMSPSSVPEGGYSEYGAKPFGSKGYKPGVVTPHVVALSLEFAPKEAISNLRKLIELYDVYGEYGFYDAVTVKTGLVARKYLALDQGMLFVAINNYLNNGSIRKYFNSDPVMKQGQHLLSSEDFDIEGQAATAPETPAAPQEEASKTPAPAQS